MKSLRKITLAGALAVLTLVLASCAEYTKAVNTKTDTSKPVFVGVNPGPHAVIMENVKKIAEKKGLQIVIREFSDFVTPNEALAVGEIWANSYQHEPFLKATMEKEPTFKLAKAFNTILLPISIYSKKLKPGDKIPDGAKIGIPNDPTNCGRSLLLLAANNLIKVKNPNDITTTVQDITDNPHQFEIVELEASAIPRSLDDLTCAAINTTYALHAGLNPAKDPIIKEAADSLYVNIVAVQEKDLKDPRLKVFQEAYQSKENAEFIKTQFPDSIYLGWKE